MEEVIKRLVQIEAEAADVERETAERIRKKKQEQEEALRSLRQEMKKKAEDKLVTLHEWGMKEVDEELEKQKAGLTKKLAAFDRIEKEKTQEWVNTLFLKLTRE